jgi:hypothetical protein
MEIGYGVAIITLLVVLLGVIVWRRKRSQVLRTTHTEQGDVEPQAPIHRSPHRTPVPLGVQTLPPPQKRKPRSVPEVIVDTPLGKVSFKKPRKPVGAIIVGLGQSEEHLRWFYDVYRREYLERAVANWRAYKRGNKDRSRWSDDYFEWIQSASAELAALDSEMQVALLQNRERISRAEPTFLGTYDTATQAREAARYLTKKREPTPNAGWLNVRVVEIPSCSSANVAHA